jgi:aspartate kinase
MTRLSRRGSFVLGTENDIVEVSIVGLGMRSHAGVAAKTFKLLADEGINIQAISTSEIKISCIVHERYTGLALRTLHDGFGLNEKPARPEPKRSACVGGHATL